MNFNAAARLSFIRPFYSTPSSIVTGANERGFNLSYVPWFRIELVEWVIHRIDGQSNAHITPIRLTSEVKYIITCTERACVDGTGPLV